MKATTIKISWLTVAGLVLTLVLSGLLFTPKAHAQALIWNNDTTVTIGANNYTIVSGSAATSIIVSSTDVTVTVPASSNFTFQSANRYLLNSVPVISTQC